MRLLLTRPLEDSAALADKLHLLGHSTVIAPLLGMRAVAGTPVSLAGVQAVLATSANGVRAFAALSAERGVPLLAVGPQTAEAARLAGFDDVVSADGDAKALVALAVKTLTPGKGALLHAAGAETAGRLSEALAEHGFCVERKVLYEAVAAETLPEQAQSALRNNALEGVMLFSPRSARIFIELCGKADLSSHAARLRAYCISAATAAKLTPHAFAKVHIAAAPNQDDMLALLSANERSQA